MGYDRKSYSRLAQIDKSNVKRLAPSWSTSLMNDMGELAAPAVYNGVMYLINGKWTFAIDVENGKQIWRTPVLIDPGIEHAPITRGAATIYNGKVFRVTIDNHLLALDMKTGQRRVGSEICGLAGGVLLDRRANRCEWRPDFRSGRR
jgi:alcohol dehydrogenase (cytochrome c)